MTNEPQLFQNKLLEYKQEDGTVLKGFSQVDLDLLHQSIKRLILIVGILGGAGLLYILWLTYYVITNGVINNIVGACI